MSHPLIAVAVGLGWAACAVALVGLACFLVLRYALAEVDRVLNGEDTGLELGLLAVMSDDPTPHGRRHG